MKYSLGLDIGTTSCGWSVINLDKKRIEDLGVRIFDGAENPKNGESLATPRREKRSMRNVFIDVAFALTSSSNFLFSKKS